MASEPPSDSPAVPAPSRARDLNDLDVFARVVERQGFSRAAKELAVPPSTVSRRVARLEERLGVRLLQRTTRTLQLTEAGRSYYASIASALREIDTAEVSLQNLQGTPRGRVRVTSIMEPFVEDMIFAFLRRYPEVTVELDLSHRRADIVAEGIDVAIRAGVLRDSTLVAHRLATLKTWVTASPEYLKIHGTPQSLRDLKDHVCVIHGTTLTGAQWQLHGSKGPERVPVRARLSVNSYTSVIEAVKLGLGLGLLSGEVIETEMRAGRLVEVLPGAAPPPIDLWVVYPSKNLVSPAVRALIEHIQGTFSSTLPRAERIARKERAKTI